MKHVDIWTDGSSRGNPGRGGWAAVINYGSTLRVVGGFEPTASNNAMETAAVLGGLRALIDPCDVTIKTDSMYVVYGMRRVSAGGIPETNIFLWNAVASLLEKSGTVTVEKIQGHGNARFNTIADSAAGHCADNQVAIDQWMDETQYGNTTRWQK